MVCDTGHPKPMLCDSLEGWGEEGRGRGIQEEGTHVCLRPFHVDVWPEAIAML